MYSNLDDLQNHKNSAWGIYNAFADMASHMDPLRKVEDYKEKRFASFLDGNKLLDRAQEVLQAA